MAQAQVSTPSDAHLGNPVPIAITVGQRLHGIIDVFRIVSLSLVSLGHCRLGIQMQPYDGNRQTACHSAASRFPWAMSPPYTPLLGPAKPGKLPMISPKWN
jgi:hypothetical protein